MSVGAHHDTITGTSKVYVHKIEKEKITQALADLARYLADAIQLFFQVESIDLNSFQIIDEYLFRRGANSE